jgi:hypothetical protein
MKPLEVINRGFGGSRYSDLNQYAKRVGIPYYPRAVVVYGRERLPGICQDRPQQAAGNLDLRHVHQAFLFEVE